MRVLLILLIALAIVGCTEVQTMNLSVTYQNVTTDQLPYTQDNSKEISGMLKNITGAGSPDTGAVEESSEDLDNGPLTVNDVSYVPVDPDNLVKKLCPEQVLLGLRSCKSLLNGDINITIKNAGYLNLTMIFYLYYDNDEMGYVYYDKPFVTKEEKVYTLDFDNIEKKYGEITKIEATPVLVQGLEALSCQNKKLPVLVQSGCK